MADEREPEQAMPRERDSGEEPRPTQPIKKTTRKQPKEDDEGFGGFMGHGGQSDIDYEGPKPDDNGEGENPNSAADTD